MTTIPVGTTPDAVAITPNGTTAYVVNAVFEHRDSVIATATNTAGDHHPGRKPVPSPSASAPTGPQPT